MLFVCCNEFVLPLSLSLFCSLRRSNCSQKCEWLWTVWAQLGKYFKILSTIKRVNNFLWFSYFILHLLSLSLSVFTFCFAKHFLVIWGSVSVYIDNIVVTVVAVFITTSTALRHALLVMLESLHLQLCESAFISLGVWVYLCVWVCVCVFEIHFYAFCFVAVLPSQQFDQWLSYWLEMNLINTIIKFTVKWVI